MSIARRTLLTTTAAGTLLCALWFVPSAKATDGTAVGQTSTVSAHGRETGTVRPSADGALLADTGTGVDTTPYLVGGTAFLVIGAGFVTYSAHRGQGHTAF